jgi:Flp pilus assembly protein TadG
MTREGTGSLGARLLRCEGGIAALEFVLLAPALLMMAFGIIIYAFYFSAVMGVRQAAAEGARAAMAGLSTIERTDLAQTRAQEVIDRYSNLLSAGAEAVRVTAQPYGTGVFQVEVSYDISDSPIMRYANFVPLPSPRITSTVLVTNGSY